MRVLFSLLLLVSGSALADADVAVIRLDTATAGATTTISAPAGTTKTLVVGRRVPTVSYELSDGRRFPAIDLGSAAEPDDPCKAPGALLSYRLKNAADETAVNSAIEDVERALASCTDAQRALLTKAEASLTTIDLGTFAITSDTDRTISLSRRDATAAKQWTMALQTAKEAEAKKKELVAAQERARLDEILDRANTALVRCAWGHDCAQDTPLFINGDHVATALFTDLPRSPVTVRVWAGEYHPCKALEVNYRTFGQAHDVIAVPLHMRTSELWLPTIEKRRTEFGLHLYGLLAAAGDNPVSHKQVCGGPLTAIERDATSVRLNGVEIPSVPLLLRGKSEAVSVEITGGDGSHQTFTVPVRYQRFWLDAGGFFAFARQTNVDLIKDPATSHDDGPPTVKVQQIRTVRDLNPSTGIVLNIHPGNFPYVAAQFGIAAQQEHQPSYYFGAGVRLRELGKRSLATVAIGLAAVETTRYPGLAEARGEDGSLVVAADSPLLVPTKKYQFEPYFSISLGFSFGGVSDRTNVVAAPGN